MFYFYDIYVFVVGLGLYWFCVDFVLVEIGDVLNVIITISMFDDKEEDVNDTNNDTRLLSLFLRCYYFCELLILMAFTIVVVQI